MSVPFERPAPPVVTQASPTRCWAAALESWMRAEEMNITISQDSLVNAFRSVPGALQARPSDRATAEVGASLIVNFTWMNAGLFSGARLTPEFWADRLQSGYIYLWYARNGVGHCGVVYGVTQSVVKLMDPWQSRGLIEQKINYLLTCQNALIGVSMFSHHVRNPFVGIFDAPAAPSSRSSDSALPGYDF